MDLADAPDNTPWPLFEHWQTTAADDDPAWWNGMAVATVDANGRPSNRVVLLKDWDPAGLVFYTNLDSRKGAALAANPHIAATFWWPARQRQVRFEGRVVPVPAAASDAYFNSRPRGSRLAAITSAQSQPVASLAALDAAYADTVAAHSGREPARPPHWGGLRIEPDRVEFWQGRDNRLHHRLHYRLQDGGWQTTLLQP